MAKRRIKNRHAVALGKLGGKAGKGIPKPKSAANGRLGGRPRKDGKPPKRRKAATSYADQAPGQETVNADRQQDLTRDTRQVEETAAPENGQPNRPASSRRLIGWTLGDGSGAEGYSVEAYFDEQGNYKGPDEHGIEPIFE